MNIKTGNTVQWVAKAGTLTGKVKSISLGLNAAGDTIAWLIVKDIVDQNNKSISNVQLPGTDGYFKMMKLRVIK